MSPIENTPIPHWIIFSLTDRRSGGQCHQSVECCVCGVTERHFTSSQESEKKKRKNLPFAQRLYSTAQQSLFISKCWWQWKWKCIFLSLLRSESQCQPFNLSSREAFFITHIIKVKVHQLLLGEQIGVVWLHLLHCSISEACMILPIFHVAVRFALNNIVWSNLCLKPQWLKPQRHLLPNLSAFKCWGPNPVAKIKVG